MSHSIVLAAIAIFVVTYALIATEKVTGWPQPSAAWPR